MSLNPFARAWVPPSSSQLPPINAPKPIEEDKGDPAQVSLKSLQRVPSSLTQALAASRGSSPALPEPAATSVQSPFLLGGSSDDEAGELNREAGIIDEKPEVSTASETISLVACESHQPNRQDPDLHEASGSSVNGESVNGDSDNECLSMDDDSSTSGRRNLSSPLPIEAAQTILHDAIREIEIDKSAVVNQSSSPRGLAMIPTNLTQSGKIGLGDFALLRIVGQGAFGKVFQVRYKRTNEILAMKVMRKEVVIQKDVGEYIRSERDLLTAVDHPYIVTLRFSFQTPQKLYLVLDFIQGGHLFFNLYREGVFSEEVARLYTAEIVSAISYLHGLGIMHRDLKVSHISPNLNPDAPNLTLTLQPENCLITTDGHVKITDFGLAKGNIHDEDERSNSFIGTMEYMAPEIVDGKGHTKSVDWWSTGILLFEMLCGVPPFKAKSRNALQTQILTSKPKFPKFISTDAQSLIKALLTKDPAKRLGSGPQGSEAIKKHSFFKSINWTKLEKGEIKSPFKPKIHSSDSTENFDKIWTDQPVEDSPCNTPKHSALVSDPTVIFRGFTFTSPSYLLSLNPAQFSCTASKPPATEEATESKPPGS